VQVSFPYFIVANYRFDSTSFTGKLFSFIALRCHSSYKAKILVCVRGSVISELSSWFSLLFITAPISTVLISTALKYVLLPGKSNSSNFAFLLQGHLDYVWLLALLYEFENDLFHLLTHTHFDGDFNEIYRSNMRKLTFLKHSLTLLSQNISQFISDFLNFLIIVHVFLCTHHRLVLRAIKYFHAVLILHDFTI